MGDPVQSSEVLLKECIDRLADTYSNLRGSIGINSQKSQVLKSQVFSGVSLEEKGINLAQRCFHEFKQWQKPDGRFFSKGPKEVSDFVTALNKNQTKLHYVRMLFQLVNALFTNTALSIPDDDKHRHLHALVEKAPNVLENRTLERHREYENFTASLVELNKALPKQLAQAPGFRK